MAERSCEISNDASLSLSSILGTGESGSGGILDLDILASVLRRAGDPNFDASDSCRRDAVGEDTDPGAVGGRWMRDAGVDSMDEPVM